MACTTLTPNETRHAAQVMLDSLNPEFEILAAPRGKFDDEDFVLIPPLPRWDWNNFYYILRLKPTYAI